MVSKTETFSLIVDIKAGAGTQQMLDSLSRSTDSMARFNRSIAQLTAEQRRAAAATSDTASALDKADRAAARGAKSAGLFGTNIKSWQLGQVSQQLGDAVVQMDLGASASRVLGQQLPQAAAAFGGLAGAAGTFIGVGFLLAPLLVRLASGTKDFATATEDLRKSSDAARSVLDVLNMNADALYESYGKAADSITRFAQVQGAIRAADIARNLADIGKQFDVALKAIQGYANDTNLTGMTDRWAEFFENFPTDRINDIRYALLAVRDAQDEAARGDAMLALADLLEDMGKSVADLPAGIRKAVDEWITMNRESAIAQKLMDNLNNAASRLPGNLSAATAQMSRMASALQTASTAINALENTTQNIELDTVQLEEQNRLLESGADAIDAQTEALLKRKRTELDIALDAPFPTAEISDEAAAKYAAYEEALRKNAEAKRKNLQITQALQQAEKSAVSDKSIDENKQTYEDFTKTLDRFKTSSQLAADAYNQLVASAGPFSEQLKNDPANLALYNKGLAELATQMNENAEMAQKLGESFEGAMTDAFVSIVDGTKTATEAFSDMLDEISREITEFLIREAVKALIKFLINIFSGGAGAATGSVATAPLTAPVTTTPVARFSTMTAPVDAATVYGRGALQAAQVLPANSILAPMSRSGENGTTVNVYNNADVSVREEKSGDGKTVDLYIEGKMKSLLGSGALDRTMRANYGLRRSG